MSTDPFNQTPDPAAGLSETDVQSLASAFADTEFRAQHAEPVVRDLNRNLTDLIGECPNTATGGWFTLNDDMSIAIHADLVDALRLSTAFQRIIEQIEVAALRRQVSGRGSILAYLQNAAQGLWAAKAETESVHLVNRKGRGLFRKGR